MEWPGFQSVAPLSEIQFRPPLAFKCHPRQALTEAARDRLSALLTAWSLGSWLEQLKLQQLECSVVGY